jgi:alginate O-acetyltransferase complex protein AlgI
MLFNSLSFLYGFLPVSYFVFWRLKTSQHRYIWLTLTGYIFYGFWDYRFCAVMAASTLISFVAGLELLRYPSGPARRLCAPLPPAKVPATRCIPVRTRPVRTLPGFHQ